jgi:hypothetical protein
MLLHYFYEGGIMTKEIPLSKGFFTIVDDEDYDFLIQWRWHYSNGYAGRRVKLGKTINGKRQRCTLYMHRVLLNTPDDMEGEHRDNNGLNNCRYNLRNATPSQNISNRSKFIKGSSKYKGVDFNKRTGLWRARISFANKRLNLGYFKSQEEAAKVYNQAAIEHHGEFAQLNTV